MRLFLTGGTGFIGSHVLSAALADGHEVIALRRSATSVPVIPLPSHPFWCEGDVNNLKSEWLIGVDAVLHLASVGVSPKRTSWSHLVEVNVVGTLQLLEMAEDAGVRRYVFAGTSHEYGNAARRYQAIPPDAPLEPLSPYGASKAASFQLTRAFAIERNLEVCYFRIFSAYGEGQFEGNFWPSLRKAALSGHDFSMTSGSQISDFIPVTEVAAYLLEACVRPDVTPGSPLVANVGSGVPSSLLAFAEAEWLRMGATGKLRPGTIPDRPDQVERFVPDLCGLSIQPNSLSNA